MTKLPPDFYDAVIEGDLIHDVFPAIPRELEANLRTLRRYVLEDAQRPILITGLNNSGKTMLARQFVSRHLPPETKVEWLDVDKTRNIWETIEAIINPLRRSQSPERLLMVMDNIGFIKPDTIQQKADVLCKISPRQFEEVIADLLVGMGMDVELTPATRDGGKDILAYMNTEMGRFLTLVEAKQHNKSRPVGVSLVRNLYGTLIDHQATTGMLVTTSRFAKPAKQFQERHKYQLTLKEYEDVVNWLLQYRRK